MIRILLIAICCLNTSSAFFDKFTFRCSAAMNCVDISKCDQSGIITKDVVTLTEDEELFRMPLVPCRTPDGELGVCCRDPDYKDDWPTDVKFYDQKGKWSTSEVKATTPSLIEAGSVTKSTIECAPGEVKLSNGKCGFIPIAEITTIRPISSVPPFKPAHSVREDSECHPDEVRLSNGQCGFVTTIRPLTKPLITTTPLPFMIIVCEPDTKLVGNKCVPIEKCKPGMILSPKGDCITQTYIPTITPAPKEKCGINTKLVGNKCVPIEECKPGMILSPKGDCITQTYIPTITPAPKEKCGINTKLVGNKCVPIEECKPGMILSPKGDCITQTYIPTITPAPKEKCGINTKLVGNKCVPIEECKPGMILSPKGECITQTYIPTITPAPKSQCGINTKLVGNKCVPIEECKLPFIKLLDGSCDCPSHLMKLDNNQCVPMTTVKPITTPGPTYLPPVTVAPCKRPFVLLSDNSTCGCKPPMVKTAFGDCAAQTYLPNVTPSTPLKIICEPNTELIGGKCEPILECKPPFIKLKDGICGCKPPMIRSQNNECGIISMVETTTNIAYIPTATPKIDCGADSKLIDGSCQPFSPYINIVTTVKPTTTVTYIPTITPAPKEKCGINTKLVGNKCVPIEECKPGMILSPKGECITQTYIPTITPAPKSQCGINTKLVGNKCVPIEECKLPFIKLLDGSCDCPSHLMKLDNNQCVPMTTVKPITTPGPTYLPPVTVTPCQRPFVLLSDNSTCGCKPPMVKTAFGDCAAQTYLPNVTPSTPLKIICEPNSELIGGKCEPFLECKPPFIKLKDGTCGCKPPMIRSQNNECGIISMVETTTNIAYISTATPKIDCGTDSKLVDGSCKPFSPYINIVTTVKPTTTVTYIPTITPAPKEKCGINTKLVGNKCVPIEECKPGMILSPKGECITQTYIPTITPAPKSQCGINTKLVGDKCVPIEECKLPFIKLLDGSCDCPSHLMKLDNNQCVPMTTVKPITTPGPTYLPPVTVTPCQRPFVLLSDNSTCGCKPPMVKTAFGDCAAQTYLPNVTPSTPLKIICEPNTELIGGKCEPILECKPPFIKLKDGTCGCKPPMIRSQNNECGIISMVETTTNIAYIPTATPKIDCGTDSKLVDGSCQPFSPYIHIVTTVKPTTTVTPLICSLPLFKLSNGSCSEKKIKICPPNTIEQPNGECHLPKITTTEKPWSIVTRKCEADQIFLNGECLSKRNVPDSLGCPRRNRTALPDKDYRMYDEADFEAGAGEFPWQGAVFSSNGKLLCTCFFTPNNTCTTTASCIKDVQPSELKIEVGIYDITIPNDVQEHRKGDKQLQMSSCKHIAYDPEYNPAVGKRDIAVLHLTTEIIHNYYTKAICLDDFYSIPFFNYDDCVLTGWGSGNTYHWSDVTLLSETECEKLVPGFDRKRESCARPVHDVCKLMEFGGGLQCRETGKRNKPSIDIYLLKGVYSGINTCDSDKQIITYSRIDFNWYKEALWNPIKYSKINF